VTSITCISGVDGTRYFTLGFHCSGFCWQALLVAYNWPEGSPRYARLAKFVETFFDRIYQFHTDSRHPKWKEINLSAEIPAWTRFKPAADWLGRQKVALRSGEAQSLADLRPAFDQFVANYTASTGKKALSPQERQRLFQEFTKFLESQTTTQSTR
jgi:hypothetical protein